MAADTADFYIEQLKRVTQSLGWTVTATQIAGKEITVTVKKTLT